ncbi:heterokaryon incompatibility protein-domain-containing protein [Apiospora marii]|uniref:Heterokaryon incompatibility protein-domain-containing protein n=1 Tax=Apiospora marii TaxID=335849 RepID=A0ABR1SRN2_9PEZI
MSCSFQGAGQSSLTGSLGVQAGTDTVRIHTSEIFEGGQPPYTPLGRNADEFRILQLQPGSWDDPVVCTTFCTRIEDRPAYTALSYAWGDPADSGEVQLNGHSIQVTRNLFAALRRLRDSECVKHLWADALCINQADSEEKARQVSLMRKVYSSSTDATMWLGECLDADLDHSIETGCWDYSAVKESLLPKVHVAKAFADLERLANNEHIFPDEQLFERPEQYSSIILMLNLPWWTRIWTLQECILPGNVTLVFGPWKISFETLEKAVNNWDNHHKDCRTFCGHRRGPKQNGLSWLFCRIEHMCGAREEVDKDKGDILWTLGAFAERQATDSRDKIFGVLGLFPEIAAHVAVDYSIHYSQVCIDFFLYMVTSMRNLRAWVGLVNIPRDPLLPTWAPNWCHPRTSLVPECLVIYEYDDSNAARNTALEFRRPCTEVLSVVGIRVGQVTQIHDSDIQVLLRDASIDALQRYPGGGTYMDTMAKFQQKGLCPFEQVFLTDVGHVGYAYKSISIGDTVHVLFGGNLPFIVREAQRKDDNQGRYHEINGPAYVFGIMDGEALDWGLEQETYFLV